MGDREAAQAAVSAALLEQAAAQRAVDDLQKNAALIKTQAQAALTAAQKSYTQAQQVLTDLNTNDYTTSLDNARNDVSKANDDLKTARDDFNKVSDLAADNPTRKTADTKFKDMQNLRYRGQQARPADQPDGRCQSPGGFHQGAGG